MPCQKTLKSVHLQELLTHHQEEQKIIGKLEQTACAEMCSDKDVPFYWQHLSSFILLDLSYGVEMRTSLQFQRDINIKHSPMKTLSFYRGGYIYIYTYKVIFTSYPSIPIPKIFHLRDQNNFFSYSSYRKDG